MRRTSLTLALILAASLAQPATAAKSAKAKPHPEAEAQALDLAKRFIAIRSVSGEGNKTAEALGVARDALKAGVERRRYRDRPG